MTDNINPYLEQSTDEVRRRVLNITKLCNTILVRINDKLEPDPMRLAGVNLVTIFLTGYNREKLSKRIIELTYPYWDNIYTKEESFFTENADKIFKDIPSVPSIFSTVFNSGLLTVKDKELIWKAFNELIEACCIYIHEKKGPTRKEIDGKIRGTYESNEYSDIKLRPWVDRYKLKLRF